MYKLYIEVNSIWKLADFGDDKPAMNYSANNIAELKDRQVNYSQALKLPFTKNNCLIFGMSEQFDVVTPFPYQRHNCRLFSNDSILAGPGSVLIVDKVTDSFEVAILSGNQDFFSLLSNSKMSDLDLGSYILGSKSFIDNYTNVNYCLPVAIFSGIADFTRKTYPFAFLKNVVEKIITSNGYTLETNLAAEAWNTKAINSCTLIPSEGSFDRLFANTNNYFTHARVTHEDYIDFGLTETGNGRAKNYVDSGYDALFPYRSIRYIPTFDCTITINFHISTTGFNTGGRLRIATVTDNGVVIQSFYDSNVLNDTFSIPISLVAGDILDLSLKKLTTGETMMGFMSTTVTWTTSAEQIADDCELYIAPNLGFETQFDLFKAFVQLFGLTVDVDNENKIVYAYTMQKLYDNKAIAKDWSNKINNVPGETSLSLAGYAQNNTISFDENSVDNVKDSGSFLVANETLDKTKELFSIKFESGLNKKIGNNTIASIPLEEIDSDNVTTFKDGKPHIVEIASLSIMINNIAYVLNIASNIKVQYFIDNFYSSLIQMLTNAKCTEDVFYLTDKDIEDFNQFVPVYVAKYGHYFYVNKINNYISEKLTKCQLIKL